jgi:hypothetical protein
MPEIEDVGIDLDAEWQDDPIILSEMNRKSINVDESEDDEVTFKEWKDRKRKARKSNAPSQVCI